MDVQWIIHNPFVESLQHCIDNVEKAGARQQVLSVRDYSTADERERIEYLDKPILAAYAENPAIIVWCLHVGNPGVYPHYQNSPAKLNIVIEHDLFCTEPEGGVATEHPTELLFFTRQHWMCRHQYQWPGRVITPARWYKQDAYLREDAREFIESPSCESYDKWQYAILADSLVYKPGPFTQGAPFRAVYEKPWKQAVGREGTVPAPVNLFGPVGIVSAQHMAGFWISRKSSILAEAVFHGCIPVMHQQPEVDSEECGLFYLKEKEVTPWPLSEVTIDKSNPTGGQHITARVITTTGDFPAKIKALQGDPALRQQVLREIGRQWLLAPAEDVWLPTVDAVVIERLKEFGWTP